MLMPSHAKNVKPYRDPQPVFTRYGIESQLDAMFSPTVQLRSGGYIVINQTEALVAIDVNSGRSTREHHIEDTALKTNVEAAEEVARQLRLRDLAGLIVIDFIDMDEKRNNRTVERRLKDALKHDRARIQVGRISHFGLMEMSRQRIRTSVLESSTENCPHCGGTGHVRSVSSVALQLLRALEEMLLKGATHNLIVRTRPRVALYVLNHKRAHLRALEERFQSRITVNADDECRRPDRLRHRSRRTGAYARAGQGAARSRPRSIRRCEDDEPSRRRYRRSRASRDGRGRERDALIADAAKAEARPSRGACASRRHGERPKTADGRTRTAAQAPSPRGAPWRRERPRARRTASTGRRRGTASIAARTTAPAMAAGRDKSADDYEVHARSRRAGSRTAKAAKAATPTAPPPARPAWRPAQPPRPRGDQHAGEPAKTAASGFKKRTRMTTSDAADTERGRRSSRSGRQRPR